MRLAKSWIIAAKDFKTYRKKRNIIYSLAVVPLIVAVLIPAAVTYGGHKNGASGIPATELVILLPAFLFFYVILAAYLPTPIASYTIVGEKVEKSLEPLLATPTNPWRVGFAAFSPALHAAHWKPPFTPRRTGSVEKAEYDHSPAAGAANRTFHVRPPSQKPGTA